MVDPLASIFNAVRSKLEFERIQRAYADEQRREQIEGKRQKDKERDERAFDELVFLTEIQRQIAEIEELMARNYEILRGKYGDDVIGGMATTWLSRERAAKLKTDDERLQALSKVFLNDDDSIKPPYKDVVDAHYVQDWSVLGKLRPEMNSLPDSDLGTDEPESKPSGLIPF